MNHFTRPVISRSLQPRFFLRFKYLFPEIIWNILITKSRTHKSKHNTTISISIKSLGKHPPRYLHELLSGIFPRHIKIHNFLHSIYERKSKMTGTSTMHHRLWILLSHRPKLQQLVAAFLPYPTQCLSMSLFYTSSWYQCSDKFCKKNCRLYCKRIRCYQLHFFCINLDVPLTSH